MWDSGDETAAACGECNWDPQEDKREQEQQQQEEEEEEEGGCCDGQEEETGVEKRQAAHPQANATKDGMGDDALQPTITYEDVYVYVYVYVIVGWSDWGSSGVEVCRQRKQSDPASCAGSEGPAGQRAPMAEGVPGAAGASSAGAEPSVPLPLDELTPEDEARYLLQLQRRCLALQRQLSEGGHTHDPPAKRPCGGAVAGGDS